jgi:hypothetical protein
MKKYAFLMLTIVVASLLILTGCTKYVCYDGSVKKLSKDCPVVKISKVSELDAGKYIDNYGLAVAQAKHQGYTRVNLYNKDATWYANVLLTDSTTGSINKLLFKIDGETGDVSCITGCEYFNPVNTTDTSTDASTTDISETTIEPVNP